MPRATYADQRQAVLDAVASAGGEISHNDLVASLEDSGNAAATAQILPMKRAGDINARLVTAVDEKATLMYTTGGNS